MFASAQERNRDARRSFAIYGSILVYLAFVAYSEYHFYNLVTHFLPQNAQVFGLLAVGVTALSALILPLALHFWVQSGMQLTTAWVFYGVHLFFVCANLILDSNANAGASLSGFFAIYGTYLLPAAIVFYAVGWIIIWAFDPTAQRAERELDFLEMQREAEHQRKLAIEQSRLEAITKAFQSRPAQQALDNWVARNAPKLLADELRISYEELGLDDEERFTWWDDQSDEERQRSFRPSRNGQPAPTS